MICSKTDLGFKSVTIACQRYRKLRYAVLSGVLSFSLCEQECCLMPSRRSAATEDSIARGGLRERVRVAVRAVATVTERLGFPKRFCLRSNRFFVIPACAAFVTRRVFPVAIASETRCGRAKKNFVCKDFLNSREGTDGEKRARESGLSVSDFGSLARLRTC